MKYLFRGILLASVLVVAGYAGQASAATVGDTAAFNVDSAYDITERSQVPAILIKNSQNLYFYIDKAWWDAQIPQKQNEISLVLDGLSNEFTGRIYPILTSIFGSEWKPGVDGDDKITILLHPMKEGVGGYFRSADEYLKIQVPTSNEREMIYLPVDQIESARLKIFLAHEFVHLITFNQKEKLRGVSDDLWLEEARADFSANILGYDNVYEGSNLQRRVRDFLAKPTDSLTEWQSSRHDYGVASLFAYYLTDHYGISILSDSLKSKLVGISSINEALAKNGYRETFSQVFNDWAITMVVNDCSISTKYCYLNKNLTNLKINPALIFLPVTGDSSLSSTNVTKNWAGNWQKVIGGNGNLTLEFSSLEGLDFEVPYIVFEKDGGYAIQHLPLVKSRGEILLKDFGTEYSSVIVIPSLQSKTSGFGAADPTYPYTLTISLSGSIPGEDQNLIQKLLAQIEDLKRQIAALQPGGAACGALNVNLYVGLNNSEVRCLQTFLKNQGVSIYPEGIASGYFGGLTRAAVVRFQRQHGIPQTGFVGPLTRTRINSLR